MLNEKPILIKITHSDSELLKRLAWFHQQPGCNWTMTRSEEGDLPELTITRHGVLLKNGA